MYNLYNILYIVRGRIGGREREGKRKGEINILMLIDLWLIIKKERRWWKEIGKRVILRID